MNSKKHCLFVLCGVLVAGASYGAGLLKAESFPGTFQDLSFETRLDALAAGYDGFEAQFDASGNCISGCPYRGISIQKMQDLVSENTAIGNAQIAQISNGAGMQAVSPQQQPSGGVGGAVPLPITQPASQWLCRHHSDVVNMNNAVPVQAPLDGNLIVTSDFGPRQPPRSGATSWHGGIDLSAPIGTPVYAPASGTVKGAPGGDCGLGVVLDHGGGWTTKYCHMDKRAVSVGDVVQAGCQIGTVGNTGVSTGPHLHYAIMYNNQPFDPLYRENRLGRPYRMDNISPGRDDGVILPGRI